MAQMTTTLMKQYEEMKQKHPDAVLLFRVGDFYETYAEDAVTASEILGITLTKRNGGSEPIYLAGFPHNDLDVYLPKLVRAGERVAICEQLEDPKIKREPASQPVELTDAEININIYRQMSAIAKDYFAFIVKNFNGDREEDKWGIPAGNYSAADFMTRKVGKGNCTLSGSDWQPVKRFKFSKWLSWLPSNEYFDETVTLKCGSFSCSFRRYDIFVYMAMWETKLKIATKERVTFEVEKADGSKAEIIKVKAIYNTDTDVTEKRVTVCKLIDNIYYELPRGKHPEECDKVDIFYKFDNGAFFKAQTEYFFNLVEKVQKYYEVPQLLRNLAKKYPIWAEVARRCGIITEDFSNVINCVISLCESFSDVMTALNTDLNNFYLLTATNALEAFGEVANIIGTVLEMARHFKDIEDLAKGIGIEMEDINKCPEEPSPNIANDKEDCPDYTASTVTNTQITINPDVNGGDAGGTATIIVVGEGKLQTISTEGNSADVPAGTNKVVSSLGRSPPVCLPRWINK